MQNVTNDFQYITLRAQDAELLMRIILARSVAAATAAVENPLPDHTFHSVAELDYCTVSYAAKCGIMEYCVIGRDDGKQYVCDDLASVLAYILRKWW